MKVISLQQNTTVRHDKPEVSLSVVVEVDGAAKPLTINADHPNWSIFQKGINDYGAGLITNSKLAEIFMNNVDLVAKATAKFVKVGDILDGRMTISNGAILVDHAPIDPALEGHILRLLRADGTPKDARNWKAFSKFVENLYSNTSEFVRDQLFGWLNYENFKGHGFTLTDDGCFIGYKGCAGTPDAPQSINTGTAIVNGVEHNGAIPNPVGAVVEMPRNKVQDDPNVGCAAGLHVGTYDYASNWARGVLVTVKVNPRDVVSVPTECAAQKIRTCRYEVLETVEKAYEELTWSDDDYEDDDYCEYCDCYVDECDCEEDDVDVLDGEVRVGDTLTFDYVRKDGAKKNYTVTVTYIDTDYLEGENEAGKPRTFHTSRVENVEKVNQASPPAASSTPAPKVEEDVEVVSFTYVRQDGVKKDYEIKVSHNDRYYLEGELTNGNGYRSFVKSRISNLKNVSSSAPTSDEETEDVASEAAPFRHPLLNDLMGALGGVISDILTAAEDDLASDDEDPGDEVEEEIRRNGYSDGPRP